MTFKNINVTETGKYTLKLLLTLSGTNDRDLAVIVNGVSRYTKSKDIINECISKGLLYEDKKHNAVFLGYDKFNAIRYAFVRGTTNIRYLKDIY